MKIALALLALLLASPALAAVDRPAVERDFQAWLQSDIWPEAKAAGVSRATFDAATRGLTIDWTLPELAPPGAPKAPPSDTQAEFGKPAAYFNEGRMDREAQEGRAKIAKLARVVAHDLAEHPRVRACRGELGDGAREPRTRDDERRQMFHRVVESRHAHANDVAALSR